MGGRKEGERGRAFKNLSAKTTISSFAVCTYRKLVLSLTIKVVEKKREMRTKNK
jgi:hypothetical protein